MRSHQLGRQPSIRHQRGVVLIIALILLAALTLGGISVYRQIGTGVLIARNLTFQQSSLAATDFGVEAARIWLMTTTANLNQASVANAYFPGWCNVSISASNLPDANNDGIGDDCKAAPPPSVFDPTTYNWNNSVLATSNDGNGNRVRYVIHRLCRISGTMNATNSQGVPQECVTAASSQQGSSAGSVAYGVQSLANTQQPYFRVTVQSVGPSSATAYSQAILY